MAHERTNIIICTSTPASHSYESTSKNLGPGGPPYSQLGLAVVHVRSHARSERRPHRKISEGRGASHSIAGSRALVQPSAGYGRQAPLGRNNRSYTKLRTHTRSASTALRNRWHPGQGDGSREYCREQCIESEIGDPFGERRRWHSMNEKTSNVDVNFGGPGLLVRDQVGSRRKFEHDQIQTAL